MILQRNTLKRHIEEHRSALENMTNNPVFQYEVKLSRISDLLKQFGT